ncbi:hypothetical protein [Citrobacter werkmanii]|uniref:mannitol dehydrogenase family protein n=1 Tax=Citrobacter werkmanii TaxID=67827 RepID=UPI001F8CBF2F|nr:hypothetical protein [Citrobacter werkmanii]CAC9204583.1 D-mannonate oxidoreductase [Citrobacter werkmanii]
MDGSQKLPQRLLDPIRIHLAKGTDHRHLVLGVAGWMRYVRGLDDKGQKIDIVDPLLPAIRLSISSIIARKNVYVRYWQLSQFFGRDLPENSSFVNAVMETYVRLEQRGARAVLESLQ